MLVNLSPSTWRLAGLGVAVGYTCFGALEILLPSRAGKEFLDVEPTENKAVDDTLALVMPMMGARDFTIAGALFVFHHTRSYKEMGVLIVAGTLLCAVDVVVAAVRKGRKVASIFGVGASIWTAIGLALMDGAADGI